MSKLNNQIFLVTGASGFVGKALTKKLLELGAKVNTVSRTDPKIDGTKHFFADITAQDTSWDLTLRGVDGVFHVAAKVAMWGPWEDFYNTNVVGTKNLLEASIKNSVKALVYTSSPSVIADGTNLKGVDESYPYPNIFKAHYPHSKSIAEKSVLESNSDKLRTLSLRPHLIFGPGDTSLTQKVVEASNSGRLKKIGSGESLVDFTFIDDCVEAHLCAMISLLENPENCSGRAYFISQGDPYPFWKWVDKVCKIHNVMPPTIMVPTFAAKFVGRILEKVWQMFNLKGEPPITEFLASELGTDHYFNINAAKERLNYKPKYTVEQGLKLIR